MLPGCLDVCKGTSTKVERSELLIAGLAFTVEQCNRAEAQKLKSLPADIFCFAASFQA